MWLQMHSLCIKLYKLWYVNSHGKSMTYFLVHGRAVLFRIKVKEHIVGVHTLFVLNYIAALLDLIHNVGIKTESYINRPVVKSNNTGRCLQEWF